MYMHRCMQDTQRSQTKLILNDILYIHDRVLSLSRYCLYPCLSHIRFNNDQYSAVSKIDTLSLDVIKQHLGCISPLASPLPPSPLSVSQASQELLMSPEPIEPEDMERSQLYQLENNSMSQDGELSVTLEEASQKIQCDEVYRSPMDQVMDIDVHSQKHPDKAKQKRSHSSDSPRQPLRQINNTMQAEGRSPGPSKLSSNQDQRTHISKFND